MASGGLYVPPTRSTVFVRWAADPEVRYVEGSGYEYYVKHLFPPGADVALCGAESGPGWGKPRKDGLRCEECVDLEDRL